MKTSHAFFALSCLIFSGCYITNTEGVTDGEPGQCENPGAHSSKTHCSSHADCGAGQACVDGTCAKVASTDAGPGCDSHYDCAVGSYCDLGSKQCVATAVCSQEADCAEGENCDLELGTCLPAGEPTCAELTTEADCSSRVDCEPVYAGVNCSCGADCTCVGGEPGCVCDSFEFFRCEALPTR